MTIVVKEYPLSQCEKGHSAHTKRECPMCVAERNSRWRTANPDKKRELAKRWKAANPDKVRESIKRWKAANPDKVRESAKRGRAANPDKQRERASARIGGLADCYIALMLGLPIAQCPPELIELKRWHVLITRELRNEKHN